MSFLAGVVGFLCGSSLAGFCAYRIIHLRFLSDILLNPLNRGEEKFLQEVARTLRYSRDASDIPDSGAQNDRQLSTTSSGSACAEARPVSWMGLQRCTTARLSTSPLSWD